MEDEMWLCCMCAYRNEGSNRICCMCDHSGPAPYARSTTTSTSASEESDVCAANTNEESRRSWTFVVCSIPRLFLSALAWPVVVRIISRGIMGAFRGHAIDTGLLCGASLGVVVGALLTSELLERLFRACWNKEQRASRTSMVGLLESVFNGSFIEEYVVLAMLLAHHWQVNIDDMTYEELYEMVGDGRGTKGASKFSTKDLPRHTILQNRTLDSNGEGTLCPICIQDLEHGETARCLPHCHHTFHMDCVDKWLILHGSCPVCRKIN